MSVIHFCCFNFFNTCFHVLSKVEWLRHAVVNTSEPLKLKTVKNVGNAPFFNFLRFCLKWRSKSALTSLMVAHMTWKVCSLTNVVYSRALSFSHTEAPFMLSFCNEVLCKGKYVCFMGLATPQRSVLKCLSLRKALKLVWPSTLLYMRWTSTI